MALQRFFLASSNVKSVCSTLPPLMITLDDVAGGSAAYVTPYWLESARRAENEMFVLILIVLMFVYHHL